MPRPKSDAEIKSARISLLLPPTLYADVVTMTQIKKCSINDFFCALAEQAVKKNRRVIDDVNDALKKAADAVNLNDDD